MDRTSIDPLFAELYPRLEHLARALLRNERVGHTLETMAIVNEAYLALRKTGTYADLDSARFFSVAARAMRNILVSHARRKRAVVHGGGRTHVPLADATAITDEGRVHEDALLPVHDLLQALDAGGEAGRRQALIFDLHVFGGLTFETIATLIPCSIREVYNEWAAVRAYLAARLRDA